MRHKRKNSPVASDFFMSSLNDQDLNISRKNWLTITNKNVCLKCSHKLISLAQKQGLWELLKHHLIVLFNRWSKSSLRQLKIVCELEINFSTVLKEPIFQIYDCHQLLANNSFSPLKQTLMEITQLPPFVFTHDLWKMYTYESN